MSAPEGPYRPIFRSDPYSWPQAVRQFRSRQNSDAQSAPADPFKAQQPPNWVRQQREQIMQQYQQRNREMMRPPEAPVWAGQAPGYMPGPPQWTGQAQPQPQPPQWVRERQQWMQEQHNTQGLNPQQQQSEPQQNSQKQDTQQHLIQQQSTPTQPRRMQGVQPPWVQSVPPWYRPAPQADEPSSDEQAKAQADAAPEIPRAPHASTRYAMPPPMWLRPMPTPGYAPYSRMPPPTPWQTGPMGWR